jgi:hypothetical protein
MGIAIDSAYSLIQEAKRCPFYGNLLTLGRQEIMFNLDDFSSLAEENDFTLYLTHSPLDDEKKFWGSLGFEKITSLDVDPYEGANIIFDLNKLNAPCMKFDCIIDGGTLEHVFHLPNALNNIHNMLNEDGRIIHFSPVNNYVDHGFVQFSPCFFCDYYTKNQYTINTTKIQIVPPNQNKNGRNFTFKEFNYDTKCIPDKHTPGDWNFVFIATKTEKSRSEKIPQQSLYEKIWAKSK